MKISKKLNLHINLVVLFSALAIVNQSSQVFASGYDKPIMWSGHFGGMAGAALSTVQGAEAIYFNPAGLSSNSKKSDELSLNISPTFITFKGPNATNDQAETSHQGFAPVSALLYQRQLNEQWGLGVGYYTSGGNDVQYDNVNFTGYTLKPTVRGQLAITEVAVGAGYKINEHWKAGFAWRGMMVAADYSSASISSNILFNVDLKGMKGSNWMGYKAGLQYTDENWGAALTYRSPMNFSANGTTGGAFDAGTGPLGITPGTVEYQSTYPQQIALGGNFKISDMWQGFAEYEWTNYGIIDKFVYNGSFSGPVIGTQILPYRMTGWKDQNVIRLAAEYGSSMPLRLGYIYTSQVVPEDYAVTTLIPPGLMHTLTVGTGKNLMEDLSVNGAFEYDFGQGSVGPGKTPKSGTYQASLMVVHLGANYSF